MEEEEAPRNGKEEEYQERSNKGGVKVTRMYESLFLFYKQKGE